MATLQELLKASQQRDLAGASPSGTPTTSALSHYNPYGVTGVTDADGINGARLLGVDGPESAGMQNGAQGNHKAQLIRDKYGVSLEDQVRLGHRATESLIQQMQGNPQFTEAGTDVYGRPLIKNEGVTDKLLSTGLYAPTDRYDQKAQGLFRAAAEKRAQLGISENDGTMIDDIRDYNIGRQAPSAWKRLKNLPSGLASATQQLVAGTGDMLLDAIDPLGNNTLLDKSKSAEQANKTWGYKTAKEVEYQTDEAVHEWKKGNYGKAILHGINAAPDTIVGSIPTIASMFIGVGEANAAGRAIAYGASKTAHMAEGAEKIAMAAEFAKSYGGLTAVKGALKANAGFAAVVGNQTNNDIDAFIQNNNGQEPDLAQIARMTAINTVTASLDKNVFADVIGKPKLMDKYFKGISESMEIVPKSKIGAIAGQVLKTSAAMGEEAGQEYIQQWGQIINQQLGTPKGTTLEQIFASQENKDSVLGAAILGAGAGGGMHGIANAPKYAKEVISGPEKTQEQLVQEYASNLSAKDKSVLEAKYGSDLSAIDYYTKEHETIREQVKNAKSVEELEAIKYTTGADVSYINNALERHKATNAAINNMTPEEVRSAEVEIANINAMKENIKQFQAENTPKGMIDSMAASNDPTGHYTPDMQEAWGAKLGALKEAMGGMSENAQVLSAKASTSDDTDLQSMKDSIIGGLSSNLGDITTQKEALNERLKASQSVKARESKQEAVDTKAIEEIIPKSILGNIFSSGAKKGEEILKDYSTKSLNEALANTADKRTKALISRVLQKRQDAKANLGFSEKATESIGEKANLRTPTREVNATMVELGKLAMSNGTISKSAKAKAIKAITVLKAHGYNSKELQEFSKAISSRKVTETTTYAKEEKVGVKEGTETTKEKGTPRVLDEKEIREELKKRGATEEQADDLIAKIQSAGMSEVLTAKDLAVGLHFEQLHDKDLGVSPRKASRKKNKLHEARNVTDQDLLKIVQEGMSIEEMVEMSNREYPANYFKRVWKKLYKGDKTEPKGVYYLEELLDTITKELEENLKIKKIMSSLVSTEDITPAQVLRGVVIALANVQSQIVSEYDINVRNNLPIEKHQAAKLGLDTQIGKAFLNSFDLRLAGGNPLNIATKYKELGDKLLALTEELGLIEVSKGSVRLAINNQVTEKNDKVENGTSTLLVTNPKKGAATYMGKAISIVGMNDKLDERPLPGDRETSLRTAVSAMYKLMSPVNYELPTSEPVTEVPSDHNIKEKQKEIVQKLNKLKFFIKPKMLKFLEKIAEEANGDFDTYFSGNGAMNKLIALEVQYSLHKMDTLLDNYLIVKMKITF